MQPLNDSFTVAVFEQAAAWIAQRPVATNRAGLEAVCDDVRGRLTRLGFKVVRHDDRGHAPVLVGLRESRLGAPWVGLVGHYDVETADGDDFEPWDTPPFEATCRHARWWARGMGDNLGPLAQRFVALSLAVEERSELPNLVWIIQGEEEIGSPLAHRLYPQLELPPVAVWLEETGYFERDGTQRLLARHLDTAHGDAMLTAVQDVAREGGRAVRCHDRFMNKAFGAAACPFLTHLAAGRPYLAIGPNDTASRIHRSNESIPAANVALSASQLLAALQAVVP